MKQLDSGTKSEIIHQRMAGSSIRQIELNLGLSRATVSKYCKGLRKNNKRAVSQVAASKAFSAKWEVKRKLVRQKAKREWASVRNDPELLALIAFYWSEGSKRSKSKTGSFAIVNSDPGLLVVCLKILRRFGIEFEASVAVYDGQDSKSAQIAWENALGIKLKVRVAKKMVQNNIFYSKHGTCTVRVKKSFELWHSMMVWIECWRSEVGVKDNWQLTPRY